MAATTRPKATAGESEAPSSIRILDAEPALGAGLTRSAFEDARRRLLAPVVSLPSGTFDPHLLRNGRASFGVLIVRGALSRELTLGGVKSSLLLGPGDLCCPWLPRHAVLTTSIEWTARSPSIVAVLDIAFVAATGRWPQLTAGLFGRATQTAERLALHATIVQLPRVEDRIRLTLWHLADLWGHVGSDGVLLRLPMTHRMIGGLVGASRSTTTLAIGVLERNGQLRRTAAGDWLLLGDAQAAALARRQRDARGPGAGDDQLDALRQQLAVLRTDQQTRLRHVQEQIDHARATRGRSASLRASIEARRAARRS